MVRIEEVIIYTNQHSHLGWRDYCDLNSEFVDDAKILANPDSLQARNELVAGDGHVVM